MFIITQIIVSKNYIPSLTVLNILRILYVSNTQYEYSILAIGGFHWQNPGETLLVLHFLTERKIW